MARAVPDLLPGASRRDPTCAYLPHVSHQVARWRLKTTM